VNNPTQVTRSRFEITQDGKTSYLEFETDNQGWLTLWHTEVPEQLRGRGLALELVTTAFPGVPSEPHLLDGVALRERP
jgi:predicted GNAT family acetyltransferase